MSTSLEHLYVVILCGGGGTRLWPLSRNSTPKQFIELVGEETLFEKTYERAKLLVDVDHIYVMTNREYVDDVTKSAPELDHSHIVAEPEKKNTALAMGVISGIISSKDKDAVVINLASDHLISNLEVFKKTVLTAADIASHGQNMVTVGILPTFPHTGFGYIHRGEKTEDVNDIPAYKVAGFREKPSLEVATDYLKSGQYYWNANLYTWSTSLMLNEFKAHANELWQSINTIVSCLDKPDFEACFSKEYSQAKEEQIDTAISEKTDKLIVLPGDFGWSDVGSWNVVHDEVEHDQNGNALIERESGASWIKLDTQNSLVSVGRKLVATIGVSDLMIVDTPDALLISTKDRAQEVKKVIDQLKKEDRLELL